MAEFPVDPLESPGWPEDNEPNTLATPEGDNEELPDEPLSSNEPAAERPRGDEPHSKQPFRDALG